MIELTPERTPTGTPAETSTPGRTPASDPGRRLEVESEHWEDERDGQSFLYVDGSVHNTGNAPVEVRIHAGGWYEEDECTDGDPESPDWEVGPTWRVLVRPDTAWRPADPWTRPLARFDDCGYESPRLWIVGAERHD